MSNSEIVPPQASGHPLPTATTGPVADAGGDGFAARLREATKSMHRDAERSGFVAELIRGRATRRGYASYLRNLVPLYANLEARLDVLDRPRPPLDAFADPALRRLPALLADLDNIAGADWMEAYPLLPEAETYALAIAEADEPRLLAHAYARYLGDLSGGQILRPLLARSLGLGPEALALYAFPAIDDIEIAKQRMRAALDTVSSQGETAQIVIAEAISAFRHTIALSTALVDDVGVDARRAMPTEA